MGKPSSTDLRSRLVGPGRRWAFPSCRGRALRRVGGQRRALGPRLQHHRHPRRQAAGRRHALASHEALGPVILAPVEAQKDTSLVELAEPLRSRHGASFAASTVWRFLDRHAMTFKENGARSRAGTARHRRAAQGLVRRPA